jgi:hypothetical protein
MGGSTIFSSGNHGKSIKTSILLYILIIHTIQDARTLVMVIQSETAAVSHIIYLNNTVSTTEVM